MKKIEISQTDLENGIIAEEVYYDIKDFLNLLQMKSDHYAKLSQNYNPSAKGNLICKVISEGTQNLHDTWKHLNSPRIFDDGSCT
jgi:hypothetical protein